jgi:hypothetical protein
VWQPVFSVEINLRPIGDLVHVDAVVHHLDPSGRDAVLHQDAFDRARCRDERVHLAILPLRKGVRLEMEVDAARRDHLRTRTWRAEGQRQRGHRHRVWIVRVDDCGFPLPDDLRQFPGRRQVDLVHRRQRYEIRPFRCAPEQLAIGMRHEDRAVAARPQAENG